jgi:hypothetical protein
MEEEVTPSEERKVCPVSPIYRVGDTVVFKYEGNVRATIEGYELLDGKVRLRCQAEISFPVPPSQVVAVEREE